MLFNKTALLLPIRSVIFALIFTIGSVIANKEISEISNWWSIVATLVNIITILLLILAAKKKDKTFWELINYEKGKTKISQVIVVSVIILFVGMGGMYLSGYLCYQKFPFLAPMMIAPVPAALAIINIPLLPVTTAFAEDGLYLGCGVNQIKNKTAAIIFPAFFFAVQHSFIPTLFDIRYMIYRFVSFLPLTMILCWYYYKKRDPIPIMIGHAIIDVATVLQILATSTIPGFYEKMSEM